MVCQGFCWLWAWLLSGAALLLGSGCVQLGSATLGVTQRDFNEAIVRAHNEQLLLNLVRLHYRDNPYFLEVGGITSQQSLGASAGLGTDFTVSTDPLRTLVRPSLGMSYSQTPTIVLSPLSGEAFVRKLISPLSLEALLHLTRSGWSIARVLTLILDRVGGLRNAPSAAGPTPTHAPHFAEFAQLVADLRSLQQADLLNLAYEQHQEGPTLALEVRGLKSHSEPLRRIRQQLGLTHDGMRYLLTQDVRRTGRDVVPLRLRSVRSILFFLSQGVDVPQLHRLSGLVTTTRHQDGRPFDWRELLGGLFQVRTRRDEPQAAYVKIRYRDHYFYIADNDLESKSTFMLLTEIFNMQAGQGVSLMPTLTLPVGR
ncbi:MAG: hypothetical protein JNM83_24340 [Myxococcales bacterium]|nr:hypothetical protein [Myxococcales bacterium]